MQVGAQIGIARGKTLGLAVGGDGAAKLVELEQGVATVVIDRRRVAGFEQLVVGRDGVGVFALFVKFVGGIEAGNHVGGVEGESE